MKLRELNILSSDTTFPFISDTYRQKKCEMYVIPLLFLSSFFFFLSLSFPTLYQAGADVADAIVQTVCDEVLLHELV
jgi:hypothetical protein